MKKSYILLSFTITLLLFIPGINVYSQYQTPAKSPGDAPDVWWEVGTLPGSFAVSSKGAATYNIPLTAAPGTAGMTPCLSLFYNSHVKNGILGVGWDLSGLSEIMRVPQNFYNDGTSDAADLQMNDVFAIDSARLLLVSGTQGTDGSVYATEIESFLRVTAKGSQGTGFGPSWFEVKTKSGNTIEYGNTTDSKVLVPNFSSVIRWRINRITDPNGNYIEFIYTLTDGESLISEIRYTGNTQLSPYNKVKFNYITKNDPSFYYIGGAKIPSTKIISSIRMETEGSTLVREYYIKYHYDFYTHLNEVYEGGSSGLRYNSTVFGWGTSASAYSYASLSTGNYLKYFHGDFNGDGIVDLLSIVRKSTYTTSDKWTIKLNETANAGPFQGSLSTTFKDFVVVDVDGDGRDEILWRRRQASPVAEIFEVYYFNGTTLVRGNTQYDLTFSNADARITLYPADFDGDGDMDYMSLKPDKNLDAFKGFTPTGPNPTFNTPNLVQLIDFNGDKRKDILVIKSSNSYIYSYNPLTGYWETIYSSTSFPVSTDRVYTGDFNGDKKTDILYYRSGWNLKFSTGMNATGFASSYSPPLRNYDPGASLADNNYYIGDFNGDGKDDIVEMYKTGTTVKNIDAYYSKGDGSFLKEVNSYLNVPIDEQFFSVIDYNSDGQKDIWRYDYLTANSTYPIVSYFHSKERRDLVQGIRNGLGVLTTLSYANLNYRSYNYLTGWSYLLTRGTETYPLQDYTGPLIVVSQTTSSNGIGGQNTTGYSYTGAKIHRKGKGFLGFVKLVSSNTDESVKDISEATLNRNYYLLRPLSNVHSALVEIETGIEKLIIAEGITQIMDVALTSMGFSDTIINYGNQRIFIAPNVISTSDFNSGKNTYTNIKYDSVGNPIYSKNQHSFFSRLDAVEIDSTDFSSFGNYGAKNKIVRQSVTSTYTGEQPIRRVATFNYDIKGNLITGNSDPGLSGSVTRNIYNNSYGLPDSVSISANGIASRTNKFNYDSKYRFINREINPFGQFVDKTYNPGTGNIDTITDIGGLKTVYFYDAFGRNIGIKTPDGITTGMDIEWDGSSRYKISTTRPHSPTTTVYYDILNREKQTTIQGQFFQISSSKTYNAAGYLTQETPGDGSWLDYYYDDRGRIDTVIYKGTLTTFITWDGVIPVVHYPDSTVKEAIQNALGNILNVKENGAETITYSYNSVGKPKTISSFGSVITFNYDNYGRQTSIINPNSGTTLFNYDNLGQLLSQVDSRNDTIRFEYDILGRQTKVKTKERETLYNYYSSGTSTGKAESIATNDGVFQTYRYDGLGRPVRVADSIPAENLSMVTKFTYDSYGNNTVIEYPSGLTINRIYDNNGYLSEIWHGTEMLWKLNSSNGRGQPVNYNLGNTSINLQVSYTYDFQGRVSAITTGQKKQTYSFDAASGNLTSRDYRVTGSQTGLTENFTYDNLNRLIQSMVEGGDTITTAYADNGNITTKSDAGTYIYDQTKTNAVVGIANNPGTIESKTDTIGYNSYNLSTTINSGDSSYSILYNPLNQRIRTVYSPGQRTSITKYFSGGYEKTITGGGTKELHYINSPFGLVAIIVKQGESLQTYYVETDHLGSIIGLINPDKTYADSASFDPWGRRRNAADWSYENVPAPLITDRGFTGHEHLDPFGLINMNGRMYDPVLGRFLGVDPVIQDGTFSQSYNGYSYCVNNPLKYTDPTGYYLDGSFDRAMQESHLRQNGVSQVDIWMMESDPNWNSYFNSGYSLGNNFLAYYYQINRKQYEPPRNFQNGYWVRETVTSDGKIIFPSGTISGIGDIPVVIVSERFVYYNPQSQGGITLLENYHGVNYYIVDGMSPNSAVTIPELGVFIEKGWYNNDLKNNPRDFKALKQHEYGHILQYKANGSELYWGFFAPLSLISATLQTLGLGNHSHDYYFIEVDANIRANQFFGNDASSLFGTPGYPTSVRNNNDFLLFDKISIKLW